MFLAEFLEMSPPMCCHLVLQGGPKTKTVTVWASSIGARAGDLMVPAASIGRGAEWEAVRCTAADIAAEATIQDV